MMDMACHSLDYMSRVLVPTVTPVHLPDTSMTVSVLCLIVNVKVQADKEYTGNQEGNKGEEDELLEEARLFELYRKLVLLLAQLVTFSLQQGIPNIIHGFFFINQFTCYN